MASLSFSNAIAPGLNRKNKARAGTRSAKLAFAGKRVPFDRCKALLRIEDQGDCMRSKFERMVLDAQEEICSAVEAMDGCNFSKDEYAKPEGGGGIARVLQDGNIWEKAGVNVSAAYGTMRKEAYQAARPTDADADVEVPYFVTGISSVMHPRNPFAPTVHFNYRYFEIEEPTGMSWWFGGGADLTPSYLIEEDVRHFHEVHKRACDNVDLSFYPRFKRWCDDYFLIEHRGERRGMGGIFFDDLHDRDPEKLLELSTGCLKSFLAGYLPIIEKRKDTPFNEAHKEWQQLRRGRYVEFNLVYDRGTRFGLLRLHNRSENVLMSLPLTARWEYNHQPSEGSEEWKLLDACRNPRDWCDLHAFS